MEDEFTLSAYKKRKVARNVLNTSQKQPVQQPQELDMKNIEMPIEKQNKPLILSQDLTIIVEAFNPLYKIAFEFLMSIAEPISRSEYIHEYILTQMSMYTAMVLQYNPNDIIKVLDLLSKNHPPAQMKEFIKLHTKNNGQAKFYLQESIYYIDLGQDVQGMVLSQLQNPKILELIENTQLEEEFEINPQLKQIEDDVLILDQQMIDNISKEINTNKDYQEVQQTRQIKYNKYKILGDYFEVTQALIRSFVPLIQEYNFQLDEQKIEINLKPTTKPRLYQLRAVKNVIIAGKARSGLIVLPCGAGKTLVGVMCLEQIKSSAIIICDSSVSVDQWRREIEKYTTIDQKRIIRITGYAKDRWTGEMPVIILTTYSWLIAQMLPSRNQQIFPKFHPWTLITENQWGVCIVDEVHRLPAVQFCNVLRMIKCAIKIGLTATLLREDMKLDNLYFMIGPKLYEENLMDLMNQGFLAKPHIIEILCDMSPIFKAEYKTRNNSIRTLLHTGNATKFKALQFLIKQHEMLGHKIIVFCDSLLILNYYAQLLGYPVIDGDLNTDEKNRIFGIFKHSNEIKTVFVSRVGDTGIDIPQASVGIEIGYLGGSRRQKVQRLGRIMRPKENEKNDIQAFFYSLASKDTAESEYSYKRQKYITEQLGLNTELLNESELPYNQNPQKYKYIKEFKELDLLENILLAAKNIGSEKIIEEQEEVQIFQVQKQFGDEITGLYKFQQ